MMNSITLLLAFLGEALAFHVVPSTRVVTRLESATSHENNHLNFNPMEGYRSVDMARAKECAEHFGECSLEEIQDLRDSTLLSKINLCMRICRYSCKRTSFSFQFPMTV